MMSKKTKIITVIVILIVIASFISSIMVDYQETYFLEKYLTMHP